MRLGPGQFFGHTRREHHAGHLFFNLSVYDRDERQPLHCHAHPTLFLLVSGDHCGHWHGREYNQPALTAVYHPTTEAHASATGPRGMVGLNVELRPGWFDRHQLREGDLGGYRPLSPSVGSGLLALRLLVSAWRDDPEAEADLETQVFEMVEPLVRTAPGENRDKENRRLRRAEEFLREEFRSAVSLRDVAREAGTHPVYFARVFRRRFGCSVGAYLRALRLAEAGRLIVRPARSLAEAAYAVGFADQAHMTRWFARELGFSPKRLREAVAGAPSG